MIADGNKILEILQLSDGSKDEIVSLLLPIVQDDVIQYTGNDFVENDRYVSGDGISFTKLTRTIADEDSGFVDNSFYAGMDVYVDGSLNNDGYYELESVLAGSVVIRNYHSLVDEDAGEGIVIWKVKFPLALTTVVAKMIKHHLNSEKYDGLQSYKLGDYSETYADIGSNSYPASIANALNQYRSIVFL